MAAVVAALLVVVCSIPYTAPASTVAPSEWGMDFGNTGETGSNVDCSFDAGDICGYEQLTTDFFDWIRNSGPTLSLNTGPDGDHTTGTGFYMYIDARGKMVDDYAVLSTPILDWPATQGCLTFWVSMYGSDVGTLRVKVVDAVQTSSIPQIVWYRTGQLGTGWKPVSITVDTTAPIRIQFEGVRGSGNTGDIAIDDVKVTQGSCTAAPTTTAPVAMPTPPLPGMFPAGGDSTALPGSSDIGPPPIGFLPGFDTTTTTPPPTTTTTTTTPPTTATVPPARTTPNLVLGSGVVTSGTGGTSGGGGMLSFPSSGGGGGNSNPLAALFPGLAPSANINNAATQAPVPFQSTLQFSCLRPSTPCDDMYGMCESATGKCMCFNQNYGLQCQVNAARGQNSGMCQINNPCQRGHCYDDGIGAACACPDGFYGSICQHDMVRTECEDDRMIVNIFPYGFNPAIWLFVQAPGTETCDMQPVSQFLMENTGYHSRGWQGFARAFKFINDPCAGNASIEWDTATSTLYSRQVYVYYGYGSGSRHPTDNVVKVTCEVPKVIPTPSPGSFPPPRIMVVVKDLNDQPIRGPIRLGRKVKVVFDVNVPNSAGVNDVQVQECVVRDAFAVNNVHIVRDGCAEPPMGQLLYQPNRGRTVLMMTMHKFPGVSAGLYFQCKAKLQTCSPANPCGNPPVCITQKIGKRSVRSLLSLQNSSFNFVRNIDDIMNTADHDANTLIVKSDVIRVLE